MTDCRINIILKNEIERIKPLWEKLNEMHLKDSQYFKDFYKCFTFEKRCEKFFKIKDDCLFIELIEDKEIPVGYCISTINKEVGEIDSIYIDEKYRKFGFGKLLIKNSIKWLKENNCSKIFVAVAEGHESVFGFYRKYDFYPRMTYLQLKD